MQVQPVYICPKTYSLTADLVLADKTGSLSCLFLVLRIRFLEFLSWN